MNRLSEIEIGGIKYLLNFSVQAASEIYERYGDTAGMQECIMDGYTEKSIAETLWVLDILARQGAEYVKLHEDGEQLFLCTDILRTLLGIREFNEVRASIFEAISKSMTETVEVKPPKNAGTTQGIATLRGFGFMDAFLQFLKKS